jgi:SulP family sulfate permease
MTRDRTRLTRWLPILAWGRHYQPADFTGDLTAGLIVASLLIPQAMAYALLAGLPPQVGLYASIAPLFIYAIFGTGRTLSVAPAALDSMLVAAGIGAIAAKDSPDYLSLAITLAFLVGGLQILMGVLRLGVLVNFISGSVITGFTSGAAVIIALGQIKHLLGLKIESSSVILPLLQNTIQALPTAQGVTMALGGGAIALLWLGNKPFSRWLQKRGVSAIAQIPLVKSVPLFIVILSTALVATLRLDQQGVAIVGSIPQGLPPLMLPTLSLDRIQTLFPLALTLSFIGFMESFAVAKSLASQRRQSVEANQELVALGLANIGSAVTGGYSIAGGLSRSVVNFSAGARTGVASMITAGVIVLTVLFLTPLFFYLPQASLAAIIFIAILKLIDLNRFRKLWRYNRADGLAFLVTFFGVLGLGVQAGIFIGAGFAIALYLWRTSRPHIAIVGRLGETEQFRNIQRHQVLTCTEVLAIRIDESLYFANTKVLEESLLHAVSDYPKIEKLLLVCSGINAIDGSALATLEQLQLALKSFGVELYFSDVKGPVMDGLERIGFVEEVGRDRFFLSAAQAMQQFDCQLA